MLLLVLPAGFFLLGYSGAMEYLGKQATVLFKLYAEAELQKLNASGNINIEGLHEFVVAMESDGLESSGEKFLGAFEGVAEVRETGFSDWYVISVDARFSQTVNNLRATSAVNFVLANRGIWMCH